MRTPVLMIVALLGCGSAPPAPSKGVGNKLPPKEDTRGSREAMVRATVSMLAAGDVNGLTALADLNEAMGRAVACAGEEGEAAKADIVRQTKKLQETIAIAAVNTKGLAIEIVEIPPGKASPLVKAGDKQGGCTVLADLTHERVKLKLSIGGKPATVLLELISVADRFYLVDLPRRFDPEDPEGTKAVMRKYTAHVDRLCACATMDCVTAATEEYGKEMAEWAKENAGREATPPSEDDKRLMEDSTKKLTDCMTSLAKQANP